MATATWRTFLREKVFYAVVLASILMLGFSFLLATLTIIETRKIMLDFGLGAVSLCGILISVFIGNFAIAKEIETRTIYSSLSKPISRTSFVIGKFLGSTSILFAVHLALGLILFLILSLAGESSPPGFWTCQALNLLESLLILAVSFLFSMVTSGFLAGSLSLAVFLIGRSGPSLITMSESAATTEVRTTARVISWLFPNLERFNIRELVAWGKEFPPEMLPIGLGYALLWIVLSLSLTSWLFEQKELR